MEINTRAHALSKHTGKPVAALSVGVLAFALTCAQPADATASGTAGTSVVVSDQFARSVASSWASADLGGAYSMSGRTGAQSVSGGHGNLTNIPAGSTVEQTLPSALARDIEAHVAFTVPPIAGSGFAMYQGVELRRQADDSAYIARVRIRAGGVATLSVIRNGPTGSYTVLSTALANVSSGQQLDLQANVTGSSPVTVQARSWVEGTTQPAWSTANDSAATAITTQGSVGTWTYISSGSTATTVAVSSLDAWNGLPTANASPILGTALSGMNYAKVNLTNTGADAMTANTGLARTAYYGNLTLSPSSPSAANLDVYGQVLFANGTTPWNATLTNVYVHGTKLATLVAPYSQNYESSKGLIQNTGSSKASIHLDGVTLIPDNPDTRWDGLLGHDFASDNWGLVIAHVTDGIGIQNVGGGMNPLINLKLNRLFIDWLAYWTFSPGSPNKPQTTHNDDIQGFGGTNISIGQGSWLGGFQSMPNGFVHSNGLVHDDPFGYVGNGASYIPPSGKSVQGNTNANIQMNITEGTWNALTLTDIYLDGANFGVNGANNIVFQNSSVTRARYGTDQYKFPTQYPSYNTIGHGLVWTASTVQHDDGSAVTIR